MEHTAFNCAQTKQGKDGQWYHLPTLFALYRMGKLAAGTAGYELAVRFMAPQDRRLLLA